jgi:hypothetical protein
MKRAGNVKSAAGSPGGLGSLTGPLKRFLRSGDDQLTDGVVGREGCTGLFADLLYDPAVDTHHRQHPAGVRLSGLIGGFGPKRDQPESIGQIDRFTRDQRGVFTDAVTGGGGAAIVALPRHAKGSDAAGQDRRLRPKRRIETRTIRSSVTTELENVDA